MQLQFQLVRVNRSDRSGGVYELALLQDPFPAIWCNQIPCNDFFPFNFGIQLLFFHSIVLFKRLITIPCNSFLVKFLSYVLCLMCYVLCVMSYVLCLMCYVLCLMIK